VALIVAGGSLGFGAEEGGEVSSEGAEVGFLAQRRVVAEFHDGDSKRVAGVVVVEDAEGLLCLGCLADAGTGISKDARGQFGAGDR